jgi:hypothetical protein
MTVTTCDRCGDEIPTGQLLRVKVRFGSAEEVTTDLCPTCRPKLDVFLRGGKLAADAAAEEVEELAEGAS